MEQVKTYDEKLEVMTMEIQPVLDYVSLEPPEGAWLPRDGPYRSVVDRCRTTWANFKEFACSVTHGAIIHALTQLKSHYPLVDLRRVATGYA